MRRLPKVVSLSRQKGNSARLSLSSFLYTFAFTCFLCASAALGSLHVFAKECFTDLDADRETLRQALENCQRQIAEDEGRLRGQQEDRTTTEYDILLIDQEINKALLRVRSSDVVIGNLGNEIVDKESTVENLNERVAENQTFLVALLQRINETEQTGFVSILLSNVSLSSFFSWTNEYQSMRETLERSIQDIQNLMGRLEASVTDLQEKKTEQSIVRQQQQAAANQVKHHKSLKQEVLKHQLALEKETQERIEVFESRAAEIHNRLFELRGSGAIPFKQALTYAKEAERATGVRPAFLLGLIKNESDLGKNVGSGSYTVDMHPTRDQPIFPYIAKVLGYADPSDLRVSANPGFGWGGAMGPAQFIPSTWVCYGGLVNVKTGTCAMKSSVIQTKSVLEPGSRGADVKRLQQFLNKQGFLVARSGPGSSGQETTVYGNAVSDAVKRFQEHYADRILRPYGYSKGTGTVGPATRAAVNQLSFYSGPWEYRASADNVRKHANNHRPSNPWNPRDAFFAAAIFLERLGAARDECSAAASYYAGTGWRTSRYRQHALNYCHAVASNARLFQRDIDFLAQ